MLRALSTFLVCAAMALPAQAIEWPWEEEKDVRYGFCKGFVMEGLAQQELGKNSRIDLWLTWNHILRADIEEGAISDADIIEGREALLALVQNSDYPGIHNIADQECFLGRNRRSDYHAET